VEKSAYPPPFSCHQSQLTGFHKVSPFCSNKSETVFRSCKKYFKRKILRQQFLYDILITFIITFLPIFPKYLKRVVFFKSIVHIRDFLLSVL